MPPRKTDGPEPGQAPYFVRSSVAAGRHPARTGRHAGNRKRPRPLPGARPG